MKPCQTPLTAPHKSVKNPILLLNNEAQKRAKEQARRREK